MCLFHREQREHNNGVAADGNNSFLKPKTHEATQEMLSFICSRCGINHSAVCDYCKVKSITRIEVKD